MEVRDSVFCPDEATKNKFRDAISYIGRSKDSQLRFTLRRHEGGWRAWRIS